MTPDDASAVCKCGRYSEKFKLDLVRKNLDGGVPVARLAKEYGVSDTQLRKWKKAFLAYGSDGVKSRKLGRPSKKADKIAEMSSQIQSLGRRIRELEEENATLRKLQDFLKGEERKRSL